MSKQTKHARLFAEDLRLISKMKPAEIKTYLALRYCSYLNVSSKHISTKCTVSQEQIATQANLSRATIARGLSMLKKRFPNTLTVTRQLSSPAIIELVIIRDPASKVSHVDTNRNLNMVTHTVVSHDETNHIYKQNNKHDNIVNFSSYFDSDF
jgi:hypothetical protein